VRAQLVPAEILEPPARDEMARIERDDAARLVDAYLQRLARREAELRLAFGRLAAGLLDTRAHHRLGFARLYDYALERLGISKREVQSAAQVARKVDAIPSLARAFADGRMNWSKLRLICGVASADSAARWIALASSCTAEVLATVVKQAGRNSALSPTEAEASARDVDEVRGNDRVDGELRAELRLHGPVRLRPLWHEVAELASRCSGASLCKWRVLEVVAAEALSGAPLATPQARREADASNENWLSHRGAREATGADGAGPPGAPGKRHADEDEPEDELAWLRRHFEPATLPDSDFESESEPDFASAPAVDPASELSPHELDARLRETLRAMQSVDWQLGCLLRTLQRLRLHRNAGYQSFARYVVERVGISASKARSLCRLEGNRSGGRAELMDAYRAGVISWARAQILLPVLSERHGAAWIQRAREVTYRRLVDEVGWACELRDRTIWWFEIAPPPLGAELDRSAGEAERQIRAHTYLGRDSAGETTGLLASADAGEVVMRFSGPASVIALFRYALAAYAQPCEAPWRAFERMLVHVRDFWTDVRPHRDPVHARDGWRCRVPCCSSRRNLQDHHIVFRSHQGGNELANRTSICAWHHLRATHAGIIRAHGDANAEIHWRIGVAPSARGFGPARVLMSTRNDVYVESLR
jgi:hypothetical protein